MKPSVDAEPSGSYLLIDRLQKVVQVRRDGVLVQEFPQAAFGVAGVGIKHRRGDGITPLGRFRIAWINLHSRFRKFIGLDYPTESYAERALAEKVIDSRQYATILKAIAEQQTPPQDTPLGGFIGIHGLGSRSLKIHHAINWTDGCIALDNEQIDSLVQLVEPGMLVVVR